MKDIAVIVLGLLLMLSAVTNGQETPSGVENELCNEDLSTIISSALEHKDSLKEKRNEIAELKRKTKTAIDEAEAIENGLQNLTAQIREMEGCPDSDALLLDCCQIKIATPSAKTGLYEIKDPCSTGRAFDNGRMNVRCDMETDSAGWIVIQRRITNGTVNFTRNWEDYETGFGDLNGEFWIGLKNIHELTTQQDVQLQISLWNDSENVTTWNYQNFRIYGPESKYRLIVSGGTGDGHDAFAYHNGRYFSTYDRDNDERSGNRAYLYQGGWWYGSSSPANLNGRHQMCGLPGVSQNGQLLSWHTGTVLEVYTNSVMMIHSKTCGLD